MSESQTHIPTYMQRRIPGRKHFETHELRRIPVLLSPEAKEAIDSSSHQGRLFPQALAEYFGGIDIVREVHVHIVPRHVHFPHQVAAPSSVQSAPRILEVTAIHEDGSIDPHRWLLNMHDLEEPPLGRDTGFRAHLMAEELVRLYPHRRRMT